jgi:hypothetical protein
MIYWILSDMAGVHGRTHDGDWEPLLKRQPASDDVERFHRHRDALARAKKLKAKGERCRPLKQEGICYYWRLPAAIESVANTPAGKELMRWAAGSATDLAEIIEFRSKRQAEAWRKRAIAEGCEVIECLGTARPAKRKGANK